MDKQTYSTTNPGIVPIDGGTAPRMLLSLKFL
jgi:hypothetical protein